MHDPRTLIRVWSVVLILALAWNPIPLLAAPPDAVSDAERAQVVEAATSIIQRDYIDRREAERLGATLRQNLAQGDYATLDDPHALAAQLTRDLREASQDLHFAVGVDPQWVVEQRQQDDPEVVRQTKARLLAESQAQNFGFHRVERLEGNVGYLDFRYFDDPELAHDTVAAVMQLLTHRDAIILDLRFNNGGYLEMAQLLCSYFLRSVPSQVLFDFYDLEEGQRIDRRQWVLPSVSGRRMPDVPLYLLTSSTTFSAAEWFAFILKNLGRATVIGEQTAGGANPVNRRVLNDRFVLQVPTGKIKDGVLGTDFQGVGVSPDVVASSESALHVAHRAALQGLIKDHPDRQQTYSWFLPQIEARQHPPQLRQDLLESLAGSYGSRKVILEGGKLYYSWDGEHRIRLEAITEDLLVVAGVDDFRFRIVSEGPVVTGLERVFLDGRTETFSKNR